jgi:hypothetical protein
VRRYVAGRMLYEPIPLVVKDFVDIGTATAIETWQKQVANAETHKVGLAKDYKKVGDLILFAPEGSFERTWRLYGLFPVFVAFGALDMNANDVVRIQATLRYDRAESVNF